MVCNTDVIIVEPPGVPKVIQKESSFSTIVGVIELSILFCGAMAFASPPISPNILGSPGLALKSSISLFKKKPNSFTYNLDPKAPLSVVVTATALPNGSTIE